MDEKERAFEQREVVTSRAHVAEVESAWSEDDVDTDRSLNAIQPVSVERIARAAAEVAEPEVEPARPRRERREALAGSFAGSDDETPTGPIFESPWSLNSLGIALLAAFLCTLLIAVGLRVKLTQTRAALAEAENAAAEAESAIAREPAGDADEKKAAGATPPEAARAPAEPAAAPAPLRDQLVLLLTVGNQGYAEKQVRALKHRCSAPLAVYRQKRGRCAYDRCFAIAVPRADADKAKGCGRVVGQSIRDRADFAAP